MPEDTKDDKKKYPEVWRMFDGVGTYLGYISENPESSPAPDKFHILINGRENPYLDELVWTFHTLGEEIYELPEHSDGEPGSYVIAPIDKEEALDMLTDNGFMAVLSSDDDHEELIREIDKLETIKGGESKRYSRS